MPIVGPTDMNSPGPGAPRVPPPYAVQRALEAYDDAYTMQLILKVTFSSTKDTRTDSPHRGDRESVSKL